MQTKLFILFIACTCTRNSTAHLQWCRYVQVRGQLGGVSSLFHHWNSRDWTQAVRLGSQTPLPCWAVLQALNLFQNVKKQLSQSTYLTCYGSGFDPPPPSTGKKNAMSTSLHYLTIQYASHSFTFRFFRTPMEVPIYKSMLIYGIWPLLSPSYLQLAYSNF